MEEKKVFVPYRGFYFLNKNRRYNELCEFVFSSPIGAFIFLILNRFKVYKSDIDRFSSPIGAFIFLMDCINLYDELYSVFVPYRGFYFLNPGLTILVFMRVKKMFCGVNLF